MREAVARFVPDGASVCMGTALEALIPFAAGHELLRQRRPAILHVQRADAEGHAHCWGTLGITRPAALAARRLIIVAEEIWPRERILSDPGLVLAPTLKVAAVVHEPFGAYPSPVQGCYGRGHDFYRRYHEDSRTGEGMQAWLDRWIHGVADWKGFLSRLGTDALDAVRVKAPRLSEPLDYGV